MKFRTICLGLIGFTVLGCSGKRGSVALNLVSLATNSELLAQEVGSSGEEGLQSLKYLFERIEICESLESDGTAYSSTSGCSVIYEGNSVTELTSQNESLGETEALAVQSGDYADYQIDLMDETSRAKLNASSSISAGTYNYAVITWALPIVFKGTVEFDSSTLKTKAATSVGSGDDRTKSWTTGNMATGSAEETVTISANGGTFFRFAKPFVVEESASYVIDLVFNPSDVIRGGDAEDFNQNGFLKMGSEDSPGDYAMYLPMLSLSPVPRLSTDTNTRETYVIGDGDNSYRLELYFNTSDTEKAILGASLINISDSLGDDAKIKEITLADDVYTFTSTATEGDGAGEGELLDGFIRDESECGLSKLFGNTSGLTCSFVNTEVVE